MVRTLRNAFALGRVAHAFMLTGVRGVGKTTTARIIARALNCTGPDGSGGPTADPCGVCANCTAILAERHPDVLEMDAASRTGVDDVREIIDATRFRPMQARAKVFIVDEVHMLSRAAFNALLKTLEEPPPHVKFLFATTELRKVPVTVLSRCQRFDLRRVRISELQQHFAGIATREGVIVEPGALDLIARAADGSVRDGLSLLDQAIAQAEGPVGAAQVADMLGLSDREAVFDLLDAVVGGKPAAALAITDRAYERGADLGTLLQDLLELLHTVTRLKTIPGLRDSGELPEAERTRGAAMADRLSVPVLARAWQMLLKGVGEVEAAPDRRAAAEMVLIRLCHVSDLPTPGDLVRRLTTGSAAGASVPSQATAGVHPGLAASQSLATAAPTEPATSRNAATATDPGAATNNATAGSVAGPGHSAPISGQIAAGTIPSVAPEPSLSPGPSPGPSTGPAITVGSAALAMPVANSGDEVAPAPPRLSNFRDVAMLVKEQREAMLHAHLLHSVHLVRFAPPVIELRPQPEAPRDLASRLSALLGNVTGTRWTIALSAAEGEPTLAEQGNAADAQRRSTAADHPLVRAILDSFPGARIETVHDATTDDYGLPLIDPLPLGEPDMPEFAPPDAEFMNEMEPDA